MKRRRLGNKPLEADIERARVWFTAAGTGAGPGPNDAQYLTLAVNADLTDERVFTPGDGLAGTDGGGGSTYTLAVDLAAAWSGLEFSSGDLRVDEDAAFTWTVKHTFTATPAIEIDVASGDPVIVLDTGGADLFVLGVDETDIKFKIDNGNLLGDTSKLELSSAGNLEIGGDFKLRAGKGLVYATSVAVGKVPLGNGARYVPGDVTVSIIADLAYAAPALTLGVANAAGAANTVLSTDATILAFDAVNPVTLVPDAAAAVGIATVMARRDHGHAIACATPASNLSVSSTNAEGAGNNFARATHSHAITTSSNPGAAAAILASDASGFLRLTGLGIGKATSGAGDIDYTGDLRPYRNATAYTGYVFVPLQTPLHCDSFEGDAFGTTVKTIIDLSDAHDAGGFGAPAGIKGAVFSISIRDSDSAGNDCYLILAPNNTADQGLVVGCGGLPDDQTARGFGVIPCDVNGDVYYQILASGAGNMDVWIHIWGYFI